jgi:dTDP-4-dehydrorhamnose 3,5-epimerase
MNFIETGIPGAYVIAPEAKADSRGSFARTWCAYEFESMGLNPRLVQCSTSINLRAGTLRGLHYQTRPHLEAKLVRCTRGRAFDVVVDLRPGSPTFGRWYGEEISARNGRMMYVPEGVAHGFQTIEDETEIFYQISTYYAPEFAAGVRWNDPEIGIDWPLPAAPIISDRDAKLPWLSAVEGYAPPAGAAA